MNNVGQVNLAGRVHGFAESVIREMGRLAQEHQAINLAQGIPDAETPPALIEAAQQAVAGDFNQYPLTWGSPSLRAAISEKVASFNGLSADPETQITVGCGSTECMQAALLALVDPGDEVILFQPFYENYLAQCLIAGARPVLVALRPPHWQLDPDELRKAISPKTKAIVLNTPGNPTGHVFSREELDSVAKLCQDFGLVAITDEIYEHIIYTDQPHVSLATLPGMADRTVTISGLSKTFCVTGWRLGYCIASPTITNGIRKVHDFLTIGAPHPLQIAGAAALKLDASYYHSLRDRYRHRRDLLLGYLRSAGFEPHEPEGAYYILSDIRSFGDEDDVSFVRRLAREAGVTAVPSSCFHSPPEAGRHLIRFMFAKKDATIHAAGERLVKWRHGSA
ncbi:MAG: aminotransferase class I/II-fold pyridoxal phosphate-dependent enzyme [Planctomycetota bacterium]